MVTTVEATSSAHALEVVQTLIKYFKFGRSLVKDMDPTKFEYSVE